jgi:hypothetical protein
MAHNMSGKKTLSFLDLSDEDIYNAWNKYQANNIIIEDGPIIGNPCWISSSQDGRLTIKGNKVAHAYEIAAFSRYWRFNIEKVPPHKNANSLSISHICGKGPRCCNPQHLVLEPKWVNDERTHCHFALFNAYNYGGYQNMEDAYDLGICPHNPPCCYLKY